MSLSQALNQFAQNLGRYRTGTSVIEIAKTLKAIYNSSSKLHITGDFRVGDIAHNVADITKARKLLQFTPSVSLKDGLTDFCWAKTPTTVATNSHCPRWRNLACS